MTAEMVACGVDRDTDTAALSHHWETTHNAAIGNMNTKDSPIKRELCE